MRHYRNYDCRHLSSSARTSISNGHGLGRPTPLRAIRIEIPLQSGRAISRTRQGTAGAGRVQSTNSLPHTPLRPILENLYDEVDDEKEDEEAARYEKNI